MTSIIHEMFRKTRQGNTTQQKQSNIMQLVKEGGRGKTVVKREDALELA